MLKSVLSKILAELSDELPSEDRCVHSDRGPMCLSCFSVLNPMPWSRLTRAHGLLVDPRNLRSAQTRLGANG